MLAKNSVGFAVEIAADGRHLGDARDMEQLGYAAPWVNGGQFDSPEHIAARVRQYDDAGADHGYLTALHSDGQPGPRDAARLLAPHVLPRT
ncbi:hypothetical protein CQY20_24150 [Mycolicibacterium agri]|uniref:Uncharacterized protein n=1 Tax=Mycolicibacterium agri TaxID=36811 RepID=A0A2A7MTH7_MYCAG|nr:hypothetical protein [Mycolicibacterium agri]PEG34793.1 hypothetical protein CQY20_24150 [Mycolicibacterium agri]GFG51399.1 hypothetical protein MAGR_28400 [Mycolicibacterium agri]